MRPTRLVLLSLTALTTACPVETESLDARAAAPDASTADAAPRADAGPVLDAGALDAAPTDAAPRPTTEDIEVTVSGIYVDTLREVQVPTDVSAWRFSALAEGSSEAPVVGAGGVDGRARIAGAPGGRRVVLVERPGRAPFAIVGTSTSIVLVETRAGRPNAAAQADTVADISVYGLSPWGEHDFLQVYSGAAGLFRLGAEYDAPNPPLPGARAVTNMLVPWDTYARLTGAAGDDIFVAHDVGEPLGNARLYRTTELARLERVSLADGATTPLTATVAPLAQDLPIDLTFDDALARDPASAHPDVLETTGIASVGWAPGVERHGLYGEWADAAWDYTTEGGERRWQTAIARPPVGFGAAVSISVMRSSAFTATGATEPAHLPAYFGRELPLADTRPGERLALTLGPPRDLQLGGVDAWSADLRGVGVQPEVRWAAPAVGRARSYEVYVFELVANGPWTQVVYRARLITDTTSVRLPAGWLSEGHDYVVDVRASETLEVSRPWTSSPTESYASVLSRSFRP